MLHNPASVPNAPVISCTALVFEPAPGPSVAVEFVTVEDQDSALLANLDQEVRIGPWLIRKHKNTARALIEIGAGQRRLIEVVNASLMANPPFDRS